MQSSSNHQTQPQYLIKILVPIPIKLKEALDKYAYDNDIPTTYAVRLALTRLLNLPDDLADVTRHPKGYDKTKAQTERRRKERAIAKLVQEQPEILTHIHALMQQSNQEKKDA